MFWPLSFKKPQGEKGGLPRAVRGRDGSHLGPRLSQESVLPNLSFPQKLNAPWDSARSWVRCGKLEE